MRARTRAFSARSEESKRGEGGGDEIGGEDEVCWNEYTA